MDNSDRRKEILNVCLDTFINKGLSETTVRDLSTALKLQSGGIYYWFKDKDEAVVACAEEAALRLENSLIFPALKDIKDPDKMIKRLKIRADEMRPTMKFFASVCALSKYEERMQPVLDRLAERYEAYARRFSKELNCDFDAVIIYFGDVANQYITYVMLAIVSFSLNMHGLFNGRIYKTTKYKRTRRVENHE